MAQELQSATPKNVGHLVICFPKNRKENLIIGSIKTNIGHTEAVAGVAGLVKLALAIKHKKIPKNLHFNNPNPKIKFDEWKLQVPTKLMDWPKTNNQKLIGGVNSFGAGGTNAHIVLEEHISKQKTKKNHIKSLHPYIFALSASTPKALTELTAKYIDFIANSTDSIEDICYSSLTRRSLLKKKIFIITNSKEHLINILKKYLNEESDENLIINNIEKQQNPKTALIFSGQGAQWYGMGRQLLQSSYIYRQILEEIDQIFVKLSGYSLIDELLKPKSESKILQTKIAQPLITALQIGLAHLYKSFNIKIDAVIGHSVGEAAAGYYAGILTLEEAIKVIYYRSKEQDQASDKGKMILVNLNYDQSLKIIDQYKNKVEIAAINNSNQIVLSGDNDA
ncbi:acyltransferase domain-containing protein, partial [Rickettsiales bacterium]|nr:acyltransferase domain-containing protein [Rickettsiales bacterium]